MVSDRISGRQKIIPLGVPRKIAASWCIVVHDVAIQNNKKARSYAGLRLFFASQCLAVRDIESFPLDYYKGHVSLAVTGFHQRHPFQYRLQHRLQKNA